MRIVIRWWELLRSVGREAGPYLLLEIFLPGGTLLALLLFLCRRGKLDIGRDAQRALRGVLRTLAVGFRSRAAGPASSTGPA